MNQKPEPFTSKILTQRHPDLENTATSSGVNTKPLIMRIKQDLYKIIIQEVGLEDPDWMSMANGNCEQARELENLYKSETITDAQQKLDAFCKKWALEAVMIEFEALLNS